MNERKGFARPEAASVGRIAVDECAAELCHAKPTPGDNYCDEHTPGTVANLALRARMERNEPRNSERRKQLSKVIGLLHLAWGELPMDDEVDPVANHIEQAVDEALALMDKEVQS